MTLYGIKRRLHFFLINKIFAGTNAYSIEIKRKLLNDIGIKVGEGTVIVGPILCTGNLMIGKNC